MTVGLSCRGGPERSILLYTTCSLMDQAQTGHTSVSTIEHVPMKMEVLPRRRGIRVRLSLLLEKETSWTFELLAQDLPTVCAQVGIGKDEVV